MDIKRSTTPPPPNDADKALALPLTPGAPLPKTVIPLSPEGPRLARAAASKSPTKLRSPPLSKRSQTAGVIKTNKLAKTKVKITNTIEAVAGGKKTTSLLDLPGEIRNIIYSYTSGSRQALLVHRPRLASLRPGTRLDRHRTLKSDVLEKEQDTALADGRDSQTALLARDTNRPFFGLTQVCRLLRQEFRPLQMQRQEIGMDLVDVEAYLKTFYPDAIAQLEALATSKDRKVDMPYTGNMTIAVGDKIKQIEKSADGIDVLPLLDVWANSFKIEAGFGRYMQAYYDATADGEAKDLYRLFGRKVEADRRCSPMNTIWRQILRTRALAAVMIHRQPTSPLQAPSPVTRGTVVFTQIPAASVPRPYIHLVFKRERAASWMTEFHSQIPQFWLMARGFDALEHFDIKVGVASASHK
ncbi:hypothetical protein SVAN01_09551 [Stagonosporopsis vannaccii]|nr:hypothetical protein SVAN01_09551 [Stagonosporopsis vannaccii]